MGLVQTAGAWELLALQCLISREYLAESGRTTLCRLLARPLF